METEPRADVVGSRYFVYIAVAFVLILTISDTIASKLIQVGPFVLSAAVVLFPVSYIFGDILTEVYGYRASRKIIWSGFVALIVMSVVYYLGQILPPASFWTSQAAYETILGAVPRIVFAGIVAYFFGEFSNSYVMSKMKIWTEGRHLWTRTIGSTVVGEGVDTIFFYTVAFIGTISSSELLTVIGSAYLFKVAYEVIATPITYAVVGWLKRTEGVDVYDRGVNYNPFALSE